MSPFGLRRVSYIPKTGVEEACTKDKSKTDEREHENGIVITCIRVLPIAIVSNGLPEASSRLASASQRSLMSGSHQVTATILDGQFVHPK